MIAKAAIVAMSLQSAWRSHPLFSATSLLGLTALAIVAGLILRRSQRWSTSLRRTVLWLSLASLVIAVVAAVIAAKLMVLPSEQLGPLFAVLGVAAGFATLLVIVASKPLGVDVQRLESTVRRIESGDLSARVGSARADELGLVGQAIDDLVGRLQLLEGERAAVEEERRTLLSNIGHDLRSPLAALQAALEA